MPPAGRLLLLSGSLGGGHDAAAAEVRRALPGWQVRQRDSMQLLGPRAGRVGESVFRAVLHTPGAYDALHFAVLRTGGPAAQWLDTRAVRPLLRALRSELERDPATLVLSVFATGASAAAALRRQGGPPSVVLCTDAAPHRLWVAAGTDAYLVTSPAAAAAVRRYAPWARVVVVSPPVAPEFTQAPSSRVARAGLGLAGNTPVVLLLGGGWGLGPLAAIAEGLAAAGVQVLVAAGNNAALAAQLRRRAATQPRLHPFGYTDRVAELMAAADLVVTTPGAATIAEARAVGRPLMLLDVVPGHGRDNVAHELARGGAGVAGGRAEQVVRTILAALEQPMRPLAPDPADPGFGEQLRTVVAGVAARG